MKKKKIKFQKIFLSLRQLTDNKKPTLSFHAREKRER